MRSCARSGNDNEGICIFIGISALIMSRCGNKGGISSRLACFACVQGRHVDFQLSHWPSDGLAHMAYRIKQRELADVRRKELDLLAASDQEKERQRKEGLYRIQKLVLIEGDDDDSIESDSDLVTTGPSDIDIHEDGQSEMGLEEPIPIIMIPM